MLLKGLIRNELPLYQVFLRSFPVPLRHRSTLDRQLINISFFMVVFYYSIFYAILFLHLRRRNFTNVPGRNTRGEKILEKLSRPRFLQDFEISRAFLPTKRAGENREKILNPAKIVFWKVVLILFSLQVLKLQRFSFKVQKYYVFVMKFDQIK